MSEVIEPSASKKCKFRSDRCSNPYKFDSHVGSSLRMVSKGMLQKFRNLSSTSRICRKCRDEYYKETKYNNLDSSNNSNLHENDPDHRNVSEIEDTDIDDLPLLGQRQLTREQELEEMLTGIKKKFKSLPDNDPMKVSILTLAPDSWSIRKIADEFNTSFRLARKSKNIKQYEGILAMPTLKQGKTLPQTTIDKVIEFYQDDNNSRVIMGGKNTVTIKDNSKSEKIQKRYFHSDIKYLHMDFIKKYPQFPVGLTKFSELRPKWCLLAGEKGTHSVCVCVIHENLNNLIDCANLKRITSGSEFGIGDYKDCIKIIMCRIPKRDCYLKECSKCPNYEKLEDHLLKMFEERNIHDIIFSLWQSTDRCTLQNYCLPVEEFISQFTSHLDKFIPHHFIANKQSEYIMNVRKNLTEQEVILHCDFSENYAYVAQNAAPGFHFNNSECSIHSVFIHYKQDSELKHQSFLLLSECRTHGTTAVYVMQKIILPEVKKLCPKVRKIIYVSDNARQHYKNKYQMVNLTHHESDFGVDAEWHTYAVAHGKTQCDSVAGKFKTDAYRASLQAKPTEAILTSESLLDWAKNHFKSIQFIYYDQQMYDKTKRFLNKRFSNPPAVTGINDAHGFFVNSSNLIIEIFSLDIKPLNIISYKLK